jgi:hypothetical protein
MTSDRSVGTIRDTQGRPAISDHIVEDDRWRDRMPASARGPRHALKHADPAPGMDAHPYFGHPDRVWVYGGRTESGIQYFPVFIERAAVARTTFRVQSIDNGPVRAYLHAIAQQGGLYDE